LDGVSVAAAANVLLDGGGLPGTLDTTGVVAAPTSAEVSVAAVGALGDAGAAVVVPASCSGSGREASEAAALFEATTAGLGFVLGLPTCSAAPFVAGVARSANLEGLEKGELFGKKEAACDK
jgi:hypothetical protein